MGRLLRIVRTGIGGALVVLGSIPLFVLLDPGRAGPAAAATLDRLGPLYGTLLWGGATLLLVAALLTMLVPSGALGRLLHRFAVALARPSRSAFAFGCTALALGAGILSTRLVHRGLPRLFDAMAQLLHARAFAAGRLTAPLPEPAASRLIQNSVVTPEGWASVYPPGHTALLALGLEGGAAWLVGPLLLAVTAAFTFLCAERLFPRRPLVSRLTGVLVSLSPFLVLLGSGYLSHVSVAAATAVALYCTLRAVAGGWGWTIPAGAAAAFAVTARPWTGLLLGASLTAGLLAVTWWREGRRPPWLLARLGGVVAGGAPLGALFLSFNQTLFGSPFRLGYELAFGPAHGLGFHRDPWGNAYGLPEVVGYLSADLLSLGVHLFETPVPWLVLVGVFLVGIPRLSQSTRIVLVWALLPVVGGILYWHHGQHFGPRMLLEAAPGWTLLVVVAVTGLVDGVVDPGTRPPAPTSASHGTAVRLLIWLVLLAVPATSLLLPGRIEASGWSADALARSRPPQPTNARAVVFVHGSWAERVGARLAAAGMRGDSVETALRRNGLCAVHRYTLARRTGGRDEALAELDLVPRPGSAPRLRSAEVGGVRVRVDPGEPRPESCAREARADRQGVVALAPLLWQTPLPGEGYPLLFRDLGPGENAAVLARHPRATAWLYVPPEPGRAPELVEYEEGMERLWGAAPGWPDAPVSSRPAPR